MEKQHIKQFVSIAANEVPEPSPYYNAMTEQAEGMGFKHLGTFKQDRGSKTYSAVMSFWLSPDSKTLARIAGGKTLGVPIRRTTLISRITGGPLLETADDFAAPDLSGGSQREVVYKAALPELYDCHRKRLPLSPEASDFAATDILVTHEEMEMAKASRLEGLGLARPLNVQRTIWRYTVKGAWQNYFSGFRKQLAAAKKQSARVRLKRPGEK